MSGAPFDRRILLGVALFAAGSFGLGLWASLTDQGPVPPAAHSRSRSAVGHHGLVALLRALGVEVEVRRAPVEQAPGRVLLLLSPDWRDLDAPVREATAERLRQARAAGPVLVTLPRFVATASGDGDRVRALQPSPDAAALALETLGLAGRITQRAGSAIGPEKPSSISATWQTIEETDLAPVLTVDGTVLLGRVGDLWVLADGSLLTNQGLAAADNAAFAAWLLAQIGAGLAPRIVVDDALHAGRAVRLWAWATEGDGGRLVGLGLATLALTLWAGAGRFGPRRPPLRPHGEGRAALIEAVAGLAHAADHGADSLGRLWQLALDEVAAAAHAPPGSPASRCAWLDARGPAQGRPAGAAALAAAVAEATDPVRTARRVAAWRAAWLTLEPGASA